MMDDLISRQAAIDAVEFGITYAKAIDVNTGESKELFKEGNDALKKAVERIKDLPSAQPEIIRCRDCIHAIEDALCGGYWCKGKAVTSNHYCGYAERRNDG